jgi:DNA (cytosine-5)-methyltransferase 1
MRQTAWAVIDCAEITRPAAIVVENVPQFPEWSFFDLWCEALKRLGYTLSQLELMATDYGVPQRRNRMFIVGMQNGARIEPPEPECTEEPPFGPHIAWDDPTPSWYCVKDATAQVQARIAKGRRNCGKRFLSQWVTGHPGVPLDEPIRTITTKDQWRVVDGDWYRPLTPREIARGMGAPDDYQIPEDVSKATAIRGLGNMVCPPVARHLGRDVRRAA